MFIETAQNTDFSTDEFQNGRFDSSAFFLNPNFD